MRKVILLIVCLCMVVAAGCGGKKGNLEPQGQLRVMGFSSQGHYVVY
jgi:hypothetical protein